jgi:hypothetical protein
MTRFFVLLLALLPLFSLNASAQVERNKLGITMFAGESVRSAHLLYTFNGFLQAEAGIGTRSVPDEESNGATVFLGGKFFSFPSDELTPFLYGQVGYTPSSPRRFSYDAGFGFQLTLFKNIQIHGGIGARVFSSAAQLEAKVQAAHFFGGASFYF